jgi:hypothetical protein
MSTVQTATEIRTFEVEIPDEQIDDLRRRIWATRWPEKESSKTPRRRADEDDAGAGRYWGEEYDFGRLEEAERAAAVRD